SAHQPDLASFPTRRSSDLEHDCGTDDHIDLPIRTQDGLNKSLLGRVVSEDLRKPLSSGKPGKTVVAERGETVTLGLLEEIEAERSEEHTSELQSLAYLVCR